MPSKLTEEMRESGRITRANRRTAATSQIREREASETQRRITQAQRSKLRTDEIREAASQRVSTQQQVAGNRRTQRVENAAIFGAANSSIGGSIGMVVALFFIMLILYLIVKNGSNFGTLVGSLGTFVHGLSSNNPLFVKNATNTTGAGISSAISTPGTGG
jgi:hypothetical protein